MPWRKNCHSTFMARRCGAPGMLPTHSEGSRITVVQIALTDTFSTAQPDTTMNRPSSSGGEARTRRPPRCCCHRDAGRRPPPPGLRTPASRGSGRRVSAVDRCRPGGPAAAHAVHDMPEVPQLQRFSHRVGDQAGGQRVDLPVVVHAGERAEVPGVAACATENPTRRANAKTPSGPYILAGRIGEHRDGQRRHGQRDQDHRPAAAGFAAMDGDNPGEHADRDGDQPAGPAAVVTWMTAPAIARAISPMTVSQ